MTAATARRFPNTIIRASAGSGKTFQLTNRYLGLLYHGVPPERILAVTFTRKAASEIFDRIILRLADAAGDEDKRAELAAAIGAADLSLEKCRELLVSVTRTLHRLRVGTLDSFFSKIAGSCSLELGLPLGWRIVKEVVDVRLRDRAIADSLSGESMQPVLTLLNLLAKGGVVRGISQLVRDTVTNLYVLARETDESAWNKVPRCKDLSAEEYAVAREALETLTFPHKSAMKEISKDREILAAQDFDGFICRGLAAKVLAGETDYQRKPITDDVRGVYEKLLQRARHELINRLANQTEATYDLLLHFRRHYEQLKQSHAALRFDDISFALSQGNASTAADEDRVTFRLDAAIDHLLLDEFQDTSLAQWSVLRPIAQRVAASPATSFFCVGDTKQAIYGWRGGLTELFDAVQCELPALHQVPLNTSYRSSPAVIEVVNRTFSQLDRHPSLESYAAAVQSWQQQFPRHETSKASLAGYVTLETSEPVEVDEKEPSDSSGAAGEAFLDFVAARIAQAYQRSPGMTIGVLTRTNQMLAGLIYRLRKLEVPASEEGGNPLIDSCAVELILSLVRLADHPADSAAAYHIARSPLAAAFELSAENIRRSGVLAKQLRRELIDDGYGRAIHRWAQLLAPACDARDRSRLQQLVELAFSYQPHSTLRPADFLEFVEQQKVADPTSSAVRVMTVHQAKGLEFDVVFLPEFDASRALTGMPPSVVTSRDKAGGEIDCVCRYTNEHEQRLLPTSFQSMFAAADDAQVHEALCVMYVAMTRAIHAMHILIKPAGKSFPKNFAGLVRAALCDDASRISGMLFLHGDPNWYELECERRKLEPNEAGILRATSAGPTKIVLAPPPQERRRGLDRQSPSRMEGGAAARVRQALALIDPQRSVAMLRGTIIHAWFEQIVWLDDGIPSDEQLLASLATVRGVEAVTASTRRAWLKDFHAMLKHKDIVAALTRSTYGQSLPTGWSACDLECEARNEWPFATIDGPQIMTGRMDRVVFLSRGGLRVAADVLDFKTDAISDSPGERLHDRVEHYRPQVAEYCKALVQQTGLPRSQVSAALLFVGPGVVVRP